MSRDPKVIARFESIGEAEAAKSALDAANIDSALSDENMVGIDWLYARAIGGIRLMVAEENVEAAREVLATSAESEDGAPREAIEDEQESVARCPECGSFHVVRSRRFELLVPLMIIVFAVGVAVNNTAVSMLGIVLVAAIAFLTPSHLCRECSARFSFSVRRQEEAVPEEEARKLDVACPRCGSIETYRVSWRRLKATTMLAAVFANLLLVFMIFWPFLDKRECDNCGLRW